MGEKWSNFHVTINLNKNDASYVPLLREAVELMVTPECLWSWLKHYSDGAKVNFTEEEKYDVLLVRCRAAFEHGGTKNKGIHVHLVIEVTHRSAVQIDARALGNIFRDVTGERINTHCRFIKGEGEDKDFILRYITKEVPSYRPRSFLNARLQEAFSGNNEEMWVEGDGV